MLPDVSSMDFKPTNNKAYTLKDLTQWYIFDVALISKVANLT